MRILVIGDFQGKFSSSLQNNLKKETFDAVIAVGDYGGISDFRPYYMKMFKLLQKKGVYLSAEEYFGAKRYKALLKKDEQATKYVLRELNRLGKPVLFIFGNSDAGWYRYPFDESERVRHGRTRFLRSLKNIRDVTYRTALFKGTGVLGFGGYMDPIVNFSSEKKTSKEARKRYDGRVKRMKKTEKKLYSLFRKMKQMDLFVFHYPPQGVFDIIRDKHNPYTGKSAGVPLFRKVIGKYKPKLVLCGHMHEYQGSRKLGQSLVVNPGDAEEDKYAIVEWPSLKIHFRR